MKQSKSGVLRNSLLLLCLCVLALSLGGPSLTAPALLHGSTSQSIGSTNNTPKQKLVVSVTFFYVKERLNYLQIVLATLYTYRLNYDVTIYIDTTTDDLAKRPDLTAMVDYIVVHDDLEDPLHLAWQHRERYTKLISEYDVFMYIEDDIQVSLAAVVNYVNLFDELWPLGMVPSFIRVESSDGMLYSTDHKRTNQKRIEDVINLRNNRYCVTPAYPYHAFWILPRYALEQHADKLIEDISAVKRIREQAASFPIWNLKYKPCIEITPEGYISPLSWVYHLPNNYVQNDTTRLGTVPMPLVMAFDRNFPNGTRIFPQE